MIPKPFINSIIHKANGSVNGGIKEYAADISLDSTDARSVYCLMYDQETIDNERAARVLDKYARR